MDRSIGCDGAGVRQHAGMKNGSIIPDTETVGNWFVMNDRCR